MLELKKEGEGKRGMLEGELSIFEAQALYEELRPCLEKKENLTLDLGGVSRIDSSVVQILMLARQHLLAHERELILVNHSEPVITALETLGLVRWFNDPVLLSREGVQP